MKKLFYILIFTFVLLFPFQVLAKEGITNYYIDATILANGDINVKEIFTLNGQYNGMNRDINFIGNTYPFDGSIDSFKGSDIYNGDSITINAVKGISYDSTLKYTDLNKEGDLFTKVNGASKGDYGVYTSYLNGSGVNLSIYNPSSYRKAFYIDYTISNMAIVHNDVAELGFNIFTSLSEYVNEMEMYIHIPGNANELRVWGHGYLLGESEIIDKNTVKITADNLEAYTKIDVRLVFDKEVLSQSHKFSNTLALDKIVKLETNLADIANQERDLYKEQVAKENRISLILTCIKVVWLVGLICMVIYVYTHYDKEYKNPIQTKYYRDFPSDNPPTTVGYLIRKKINNDDLSASILMLVYKNVLTFEAVKGKKDDYILTYHQTPNLNLSDQKLLEFLFIRDFSSIKDLSQVTLSNLKKQATARYEKMLRFYTEWSKLTLDVAKQANFFETVSGKRLWHILYGMLGFVLVFSHYNYYLDGFKLIISIVTFLASIGSIIYFSTYTKRTQEGNIEYHKWLGLKYFMEDFGTMDTKDLPEIVLWEKYLVYALTLGCASKLAKVMRIKAEELQNIDSINNSYIFDYYRFNAIVNFNHVIGSTMQSTLNSAYQARNIANSSYSSGSGHGGGFSGGFSSGGTGGSFGGGGGGGRF